VIFAGVSKTGSVRAANGTVDIVLDPGTSDIQEYDTASLMLKKDLLRGSTISVRGVVICQSARVCILEPDGPIAEMIGIGLENLPIVVQKRIVLNPPRDTCSELLTGFFDGVQLAVSNVQFRSDPECASRF
jgi:hypothetical protein